MCASLSQLPCPPVVASTELLLPRQSVRKQQSPHGAADRTSGTQAAHSFEDVSPDGSPFFPQPSIHGAAAWDVFKTEAGQAMYRYIPFAAPHTFAEWLTQGEGHRRDPGWLTFALFDKSWAAGPRLAGTISLLNTSAENCCAEVGAVYIFPEFQVSFRALASSAGRRACGQAGRLLMSTSSSVAHPCKYARYVAATQMGLRGARSAVSVASGICIEYSLHRLIWPLPLSSRMTWRANSLNLPSVSAAKRFGFTYEGRMLWDRCFASLVLFCMCDPS